MSIQLLNYLNAGNNSIFKNWIDSLDKNPNIAWYPSCGEDFRSVVYLSPEYNNVNPPAKEINIYPDIFLYTDYYPWSTSSFIHNIKRIGLLYSDNRTQVRILNTEFLQKLNIPLNPKIVDFPETTNHAGSVYYIEISLKSKILGDFKAKVIYVFVENEGFCSKVLLPNNAEIAQIINIRYGGGLGGGGKCSGGWLQRVFKKLNTKIYINDSRFYEQEADKYAIEFYPNLNGEIPEYEVLRTIDGEKWSNHGDIRWNLIKY